MASSVVTEATGKRVFAIGDVHGCPDEIAIMLRHLSEKEGVSSDDVVIFLGDYIDRGPDSKAVVDVLLEFRQNHPEARFLKGNHEDMLLDFLGFGGRLGHAFLYNGGLETMQSYGISVFAPPEEMTSALPQDHFKFMCSLESIVVANDKFICVHAGLNPLRDMNAQNDSDVFWIRDEFISNVHAFEKTVIFGHTPYKEIFIHLPYKMGLDTGLVFGNKLSCIELTGGSVLQIERDTTEVMVTQLDLSEIGN